MDLLHWFVAVLVVGIALWIAAQFTFFPERIVQWQGRFYRFWYKDNFGMSDEDINKMPQTPWDNALMGLRSEFIARAPEHPDDFPGLLSVHRIFGYIMFAIIILPLVCGGCGVLTGTLRVVN